MYAIFKNGKRTVRRMFANYEQARQHVRKMLRKQFKDNVIRAKYDQTIGFWDAISRNPTNYTGVGYTIRQV